MIQIRKLYHKGNDQIGIYFGFEEALKEKARSIGARWSQTKKCWYLLYNRDNYNKISTIPLVFNEGLFVRRL